MRLATQIRRLTLRNFRGSHLLTVTLVACMFMNSSALVMPAQDLQRGEVLDLQSLVASMASNEASPRETGPDRLSVLDIQRLLGDSTGASRHEQRDELTEVWALAPAIHRGDNPDPCPAATYRAVEVAQYAAEGLPNGAQPFKAPPPSRETERYRMMLCPHAPPASIHGECVQPVTSFNLI